MYVVAPASRLRRGARRLALALCALILGAGFTPALPPSIVEGSAPPVAAAAPATAPAAPARQSTADVPAALRSSPEFPPAIWVSTSTMEAFAVDVLDGVTVGAVAGRAPPRTSA